MDKLNKILELLKSKKCNFNESIELQLKIDINKQTDHIRKVIYLPHSRQKIPVVGVITENKDLAVSYGADQAGVNEIIDTIKTKIPYDLIFLSKNMRKNLSSVSSILGKKRKMPNEKDDTILSDEKDFLKIKYTKEGKRVVIRSDAQGFIKCSFGKISNSIEELNNNLNIILREFNINKLNTIGIKTTMGKLHSLK